ncbi:MAG TPA: hypothetical protein VFE24_15705 [Pirellulales bacterium]|jgi:hypothetical protein|nr:hypothetical protein [Pirellulales bacterium]
MARTYAAVLGYVAFFAEMARGVVHGSGSEGVLLAAIFGLLGFAAVGYFCGLIGEAILRDSIESLVTKEIANRGAAPAK